MRQTRLSESRRQQYLSLMGTQLWYARRIAPAAAQTPSFIIDADPEAKNRAPSPSRLAVDLKSAPVSNGPQPDAGPPLNQDQSAVTALSVAPAVPKVDSETHTVKRVLASRANDADNVQHVSVRLFCASTLIILTQCSDLQLPETEEKLLANLLFALSGESQEVKYAGDFCWPAFEQVLLEENCAELKKELLQRWLTASVQSIGDKRVVLLGIADDQELDTVLKGYSNAVVQCVDDSLADMLLDPSAKLRVWKQLKEV